MLVKLLSFITTMVLVITGTFASAQNFTITGKIGTGNDLRPVSGATIQLKGSTVATTSGVDGRYSIAVPSGDGVLVISYVGYEAQEEPINSRNEINVTLSPSNEQLGEVVVIGYGVVRKVPVITNTMVVIKGSSLTNMAAILIL